MGSWLKQTGCLCAALIVMTVMVMWPLKPAGAASDWQQSNGPYGGDVKAVATDPRNCQILYAGTYGAGVFKTVNGGGSWSSINEGFPANAPIYIASLAIDPGNPDIIYTGTINGVYKSINGGATWSFASNGMPSSNFPDIFSLSIDPTNGEKIYALTSNGIFRSTNGGTTWAIVNLCPEVKGTCPTTIQKGSIVIAPSNSQVIYANFDDSILKTVDGGVTWNGAGNGVYNITSHLVVDQTDSEFLYVGTFWGIYKTNDGGATWAAVLQTTQDPAYVQSIAIDPTNKLTAYAGTYFGEILRTLDGGITWTPMGDTGFASIPVNSMAIGSASPQTLYIGSGGGGIFNTSDGGISWVRSNQGLSAMAIYSLIIDSKEQLNPNNSQAMYIKANGGIFKTTDGGEVWAFLETSDSAYDISSRLVIDPANTQVAYRILSDGIYKTTDGGLTWVKSLDHLMAWELVIDPYNTQVVYAATWQGIFKTTDGGKTWSKPVSSADLVVDAIGISHMDSNVLYAGTTTGVYKTEDAGTTWDRLSVCIDNVEDYAGRDVIPGVTCLEPSIHSITIDPKNTQVVYLMAEKGVLRSSDGGMSWQTIGGAFANTYLRALAIDYIRQTIYVGTSNRGVYNIAIPPGIPDAPSLVTAIGGYEQATLTFTPPAFDGGSSITGYIVTSTPGDITVTGTSSPITVTGLTNGITYTFTVVAVNSAGRSIPSISNSVIPGILPPRAPMIVTATAGNHQATVSFVVTHDGGSQITSYTVVSDPGNITVTGSSSPITITGLTNGVSYRFRVTATNSVGTGAAAESNPVTPYATYQISVEAAANVTITPASPQTIMEGAPTFITIIPEPGYGATATGCGGRMLTDQITFSTAPVSGNCTITVYSAKRSGGTGDGPPTIVDALKALKGVNRLIALAPEETIAYDVAPLGDSGSPVGNGSLDIADVILILRRISGIEVW